jgi:hypothetical protein
MHATACAKTPKLPPLENIENDNPKTWRTERRHPLGSKSWRLIVNVYYNSEKCFNNHIFDGLTVMISACHLRQSAGDRGSTPRQRAYYL